MDENDDGEMVFLQGARWSWPAAFAELLIAACGFFESLAVQFQRMHNLKVDKDDRQADGEKFATDIMSGLKDL